MGAAHDTTSDDVTVYDLATVPASHAEDLATLQGQRQQASLLARIERSAKLDQSDADDLWRRGQDWSQVRPEWGLAGCASFIAAPRSMTQGRNLSGRSFLHSYDWRKDSEFKVLEAILTAPLIVASWINLQYYGSVCAPDQFGSGNKTLHNVVGSIGVLEGGSGDLRSGLPWQSVHDGEKLMHEPLRLTAVVAAPVDAIRQIISRHPSLTALVQNRWIYLFALGDDGSVTRV